MIGSDLLQENIITFLKTQAPIVAIVGDEIRSEYYLGDDYKYPALRVSIPTSRPDLRNSNCPTKFNIIEFSVYIFTSGSSHLQCQQIQTLVAEAFRDITITGNGITSFQLHGEIYSVISSYTEEWRGEVRVSGKVYD